jgi:hypothetical protein
LSAVVLIVLDVCRTTKAADRCAEERSDSIVAVEQSRVFIVVRTTRVVSGR